MSNSSYLLSINFDSTKENRNGTKNVCDLSECEFRIPLSYMILASQDAKIANSIIWEYEHPVAIIANFYKGREKLFEFLDKLLEENIFERSKLEKHIKLTKDFLLDKKQENPYIILECWELFEMLYGEPEDNNKEVFETFIVDIDKTIENCVKGFREEKDEEELWESLGINNWYNNSHCS